MTRRSFLALSAVATVTAAPLYTSSAFGNFRLEGKAKISYPNGRLRMENETDCVLWCPESFPDRIEITWEFRPIREPGLCIFFFAAKGLHGEDIFDPKLPARNGDYPQYHSGAINTLHVSYFRRRYPEERAFHLSISARAKGSS